MRASLLLVLVPLLGLGELGLHEYFARRAPAAADYAALAPELLKLKQPGVPVVIAPAWAEPLLRAAAPAAFPIGELTRMDNSGFAAFIEVSALGQRAPELEGFSLENTRRIGEFSVSLRRNPRSEPAVFDFVTAVDAGEVEVFTELEGVRTPCAAAEHPRVKTGGLHGHLAYPRRRYECARERFVGVTLTEDQNYRPHRCVLVQPPPSGQVILRFNSLPKVRRFVGYFGFSWFLERDTELASVELSLSSGGAELRTWRVAGDEGWSRFESGGIDGGTVELAVRRLESSQSDFCFALEAR